MNLRSIDLNLLVILDALLEEAHVSRAAQRLNLSQPAVSNALQRCRTLFDDPLLERGRGDMRRTARAEKLRAPLRSVLADVEAIIDPAPIRLRDLEQVVRITASDDPTALLARPLLTRLARSAPGITIVFRPWRGPEAVRRELLDGDTDLAISVFERNEKDLATVALLDARYLVAMRRDHPAAGRLDLDSWLAWPHVVVSGHGDRRTPLDAQIGAMGRRRRVSLVVPSFQLVPAILANTDFLAMLPEKTIAAQANFDLHAVPPPIQVDGFPLHLAWHVRQSGDQGVRHVAEIVRACFG